ncbi:MAG: SGNH/GDSL hydrolase family protein [Ahrensia sp.]|nr:SGNH/GDSL hydrolase family protein [Ahrensia sp.]
MHPVLTGLISTLLFPIYLVQGVYVREKSMRLSPAKGPRSGKAGRGEPSVRLLTVGDSSAAAVGCTFTHEAMAPQLAAKIEAATGNAVSWHISGHNSAVAGEIRDIVLPNVPDHGYTHILIMLGINDLKNWHTSGRWKKEFGGLLYGLRARFPEARLYWCQALDMTTVPSLPKPLSTIMNMRRALINRTGAQLCVERGAVCIPPLPVPDDEGFCEDGFHANATGYNYWADHIMKFWNCEPRSSPAVSEFV